MITAKEFFRDKIKELHPHMETITLWKITITAEQGMRWGYEYSILKAKFHVEAALEAAKNKVIVEQDYYENEFGDTLMGSCNIDYGSILEAYPLENIK